MSVYCAFRFDDVHFTDVSKFISKHSLKCYITEEEAKNKHWHCLFEIPDQGKTPTKCFKEKIYRCLGGRANDATKSTSKIDDLEGYKRYISKGSDGETLPNVKFNTLDVDVNKYHNDYWTIWDKKEADKKARLDKPARKSKCMLELLMDYACTQTSKAQCSGWMDCRKLIMKYYIINFKVFPEQFMLERMSKTLFIQLTRKWYPNQSLDHLVDTALNLY